MVRNLSKKKILKTKLKFPKSTQFFTELSFLFQTTPVSPL